MKKIIVLLFIAIATLQASADNYFTAGDGEIVRVKPRYFTNSIKFPLNIWAHFDNRLDHWWLQFTYPSSVTPHHASPADGLNVPYLLSDGTSAICKPTLMSNNESNIYSCSITDIGYWDPDNNGIYEPYGTVKWGPGDCGTMFTVFLNLLSDTGGTITIDGYLYSGYDARGNTVSVTENEHFVKSFKLVVGYKTGDVDGNENVNMGDLTELINYLLTAQSLDAYQLSAADVNGDEQVGMEDLTALINYLLTGNW